jgi:hypothetical protein
VFANVADGTVPRQNDDGKSKRLSEQFKYRKLLESVLKPLVTQVTVPEFDVAGAERTIKNTPVSGEYVALATWTLPVPELCKGAQDAIEALSYEENRKPLMEIVLNVVLMLRLLG